MKKVIVLLLLNIFTIVSMTAQITITNADMPSVNDTFRLSTTTNIQGLNETVTGANYSWNFSTLVPDAQRLDTFFSVSSTPFAYQFYFNNQFSYPNHKASYALRGQDISVPQVDITEVFNFIKNSSTAYDNVGFGSKINGVPSSTQKVPVDREYEFPMNYLGNHISNSEFGMSVPGFGYYGQSMERIDTVDGWGTLMLPNGTYNVLRVKSILNKIDTTYINQFSFGSTTPRPEEIEYKWLSAGTGIPLLKIITNSGFVSGVEYQDDYVFVGIEKIYKINRVTVFPNPTQKHLIIDFNAVFSGNLIVNLKSILGRDVAIIYDENIDAGNNKLLIDLTKYSVQPGIYFLDLLIDNEQNYTQKIIIIE